MSLDIEAVHKLLSILDLTRQWPHMSALQTAAQRALNDHMKAAEEENAAAKKEEDDRIAKAKADHEAQVAAQAAKARIEEEKAREEGEARRREQLEKDQRIAASAPKTTRVEVPDEPTGQDLGAGSESGTPSMRQTDEVRRRDLNE